MICVKTDRELFAFPFYYVKKIIKSVGQKKRENN